MARVIHFEIPVNDADRAIAFYQKVFGWKIEKWPGPMEYWLVNAGDDGGKLIMPKTPIPGVGYFAYCEDPEGNLFGVMQADSNAK